MTKFDQKTDDFLDYLSLIPKENTNSPLNSLWDVIEGEVKILGIINNDKVTISQTILRNRPSTDWHIHPESEYILLYEGSPIIMEWIENGVTFEKKVEFNTMCLIKANQAHRLKSSEGNSKLIVITIPGSKDFPKGLIDVW